jgi:hypothetical protein
MPRCNRRGRLHRLLQLCPGGEAVYNRDNRLDADLVVVDEASMLDVLLANTLVTAATAMSRTPRVPSLQSVCTCRSPRTAASVSTAGSCPCRARSISPVLSRMAGGMYCRPRKA